MFLGSLEHGQHHFQRAGVERCSYPPRKIPSETVEINTSRHQSDQSTYNIPISVYLRSSKITGFKLNIIMYIQVFACEVVVQYSIV